MQAHQVQNMSQETGDRNEDASAFEDLRRRAQITKKTRFQASIRLERRHKLSYFSISLLSLFVILISLLPNIYDLSNKNEQILLALTIVNSVFIIITTFLEASGNFVHKGEHLHRSARKVASVYSKLLLLDEMERTNSGTIGNLQNEFQMALDECPFNHESLDYFHVKIEEPYLFSGKQYGRKSSWVLLKIGKLEYWIRELLWLIPHAVVTIGTLTMVVHIISMLEKS